MTYEIRPMAEDDIDRVYELEKRIFEDSWSRNSFVKELGNADISHPLVMVTGQDIAGYAVVWYYAEELHIANFAIAPEYRGLGLGSILLEHVLNLEANYRFAYLEVRQSNGAAIGLYKKFGFAELYRRERYYRNGEDALIMIYNNKHQP